MNKLINAIFPQPRFSSVMAWLQLALGVAGLIVLLRIHAQMTEQLNYSFVEYSSLQRERTVKVTNWPDNTAPMPVEIKK
jgi:hypothetical protein